MREPQPADRPRVPTPLVLAAHAAHALRAHTTRDAARVFVLLVTDAAVVFALALASHYIDSPLTELPPLPASPLHALLGTPPGIWSRVAAVVLALILLETYRTGDRRRQFLPLMSAALLGVVIAYWNTMVVRPAAVLDVLPWSVLVGAGLVLSRRTLDRVINATRRYWDTPRRALVVGTAEGADAVLQSAALRSNGAFNIVGRVATLEEADPSALGHLPDLPALLDGHEIETVILAGALSVADFRSVLLMADAAGCGVFTVPGTEEHKGASPRVEYHGGRALVRLSRPGTRGRQQVLKRALDILAAGAGLIVLSPLLLAIALAVRCTSPGPVLFRQQRVGRGGRLFWIYKFRSMVADAEAQKAALAAQSMYGSVHLFKLARDPRITPLGAFLRKTSLDELPQLLNVLKGDMSLVGPRPPLPSEVAHYDEHHYVRLCARPGITGPWQVSGRNGITDFEQVVRLEQDYLQAWSIGKDISILLRTVPAVVLQRGAC